MRISRLLTPLAAAILLAGCATSDPYGGQTQRSSTAMGTGIGAAIG
ncbi:MAG TPA: cell envelope biogenesis protein OmpA, partial [Halomonas sp.]|nr:cell envelope biogenesis protein OmpA [Halomonas sp.]